MDAAKGICRGLGSDLPSIHSAEQNDILRQVAVISQYYLWLGLHDLDQNGTFEWTDGTAVNYTNWENGVQPPTGPRCVLIKKDGFWIRYACIDANGVGCLLT
jgi:hypothetical protein